MEAQIVHSDPRLHYHACFDNHFPQHIRSALGCYGLRGESLCKWDLERGLHNAMTEV